MKYEKQINRTALYAEKGISNCYGSRLTIEVVSRYFPAVLRRKRFTPKESALFSRACDLFTDRLRLNHSVSEAIKLVVEEIEGEKDKWISI